MIRVIIAGIAMGMANVIPGISGGSMLVIFRIYDQLMDILANFFKFSKEKQVESATFCILLAFGLVIGIIGFANIILLFLNHMYNATMWWFIGLIICSYPAIRQKEMHGQPVKITYFLIGFIIMLFFALFSNTETTLLTTTPVLTIGLVINLLIMGMIAGSTMIIPGISGSLVLLILGYYGLFNYYAAHALSFHLNILIPLFIIFIGVLVSVIFTSKVISKLLKKNRIKTMSLILGLILGSLIVLIPFNGYSTIVIIQSLIGYILGAGIMILINRKI